MRGRATGATVYGVSERAGLSISTVSPAFDHPDRVAEGTRRRVVDAAAALGDRPIGPRSRSGLLRVLVAAPFSNYASYQCCLAGVLAAARGTSVEVLLHEPQRSGAFVSAGVPRHQGLRSVLAVDDLAADLATDLSAPGSRFETRLLGLLTRHWLPTALTGYDDGPLAAALGITSVRLGFEESGRLALQLLAAGAARGEHRGR